MVVNLRRHRRKRADETGYVWEVGMLARDRKAMHRYRVFLNDREVTHRTFYVDSRRGIVRMFVLHPIHDQPFVNETTGEIATIERRGRVRLVRKAA